MPATSKEILFRIRGRDEGASAAAKNTADALSRLERHIKDANRASQRTNKSFKGLVGQVTSMNNAINLFGATIRQVGQGLQNFGTIMSIFVTAPIAGAMKVTTDAILDLDDALIEARKNAGLTREEVAELRKGLLELSSTTPTDVGALGQIAADAGRLGISGVDNILSFTRAIDMLQNATALTSQTAATHIGRLVNIFQEDLKSGTKDFQEFVIGLGSAINELGQNVAANEEEIVQAALRIAPAAKTIGTSAPDVLALAASIVEVSASAQRGGTQVSSAMTQIAQKAEQVAAAVGMDITAFRSLVEENPTEALLALFDTVGKIPDPLERAAVAADLFGRVGGKASLGMLQNLEGVAENVAIARKAFEDGTSLAEEFDRSLDSVRNQLRLVRNNVLLIGSSLADVFLPQITELSAIAVPAAQAVAQAFSKMSPEIRRNIVLVAAAAAVIGPLSLFLGSIAFSLGIITTGLTTGFIFVGKVIGRIVSIVSLISSLLSPLGLVVAAIVAIGVAVYNSGTSLQEFVGMLADLAGDAYRYGYQIMASFANGITAAASAVINAIVSVINAFIGYIRAYSPPKKGPLKDVEKWGKGVAQAFLDGFSKVGAQPVLRFVGMISGAFEGALRSLPPMFMDVFGDISGVIGNALSALGGALGFDKNDIETWIIDARSSLAELLSAMATGAGDVGALFERLRLKLGQFADDIANLLELQLKYNAAQERLKDIREELASLDTYLDKEIDAIAKRTDLTAEERAALIRAAKLKTAARRKDLKEQEKAAEDSVDSIRSEIDAQRELIRALMEALQARREIADVVSGVKPPSGGGGSVSPILPDIDVGSISAGIDEAKEKLSSFFVDVGDKAESFKSKVSEAKLLVDGFIAGITGQNIDPIEFETIGEKFHEGFDKGAAIRIKIKVWLASLLAFKRKLKLVGDALYTGFSNAKTNLENLGISDFISSQISSAVQSFIDNFGESSTFYQNATKVRDVLGDVATNIGKIGASALLAMFGGLPSFSGLLGNLAGIASNLLQNLVGVVGVISGFADIVIFGEEPNDVDELRDALSLINPELEKFAPNIVSAANGVRQFVDDALVKLQGINFGLIASGILSVIVLGGALLGIPGAMLGAIAVIGFLALAISKTEDPLRTLKDAWDSFKDGLKEGLGVDENTIEGWRKTFEDFGKALADVAASIVLLVDSGAEETADNIEKGGLAGLTAFIGFLTGKLFRAGVDAVADLADQFTRLVGSVELAIGFFTGNPNLIRRGARMIANSLQNTANRLRENADNASDWEASIYRARAAIFQEDADFYKQVADSGGTMADMFLSGIVTGLSNKEKKESIWSKISKDIFGFDLTFGADIDFMEGIDRALNATPGGGLIRFGIQIGAMLGKAIVDGISNGLVNMGQALADLLPEDGSFLKSIQDNLTFGPGISGLGVAFGKAIAGVIVESISADLSNVGEWFKETFPGFMSWWKRGKLLYMAMSKLIAAFIMNKLKEEILDDFYAFNSLVSSFFAWWNASWTLVKAAGKLVGAAIMSAITSSIESAKNAFDKITSNLRDWLSRQIEGAGGLWDAAKDVGTKIVRGIKSGIADAWNDLVGFLRSKIESLDVFGWLKGKFGGGNKDSGNSVSGQSFGGGFRSALPSVKLPGFTPELSPVGASGSVYNISVNINGANIDKTTARSIAEEIGRELDRIQRRRM